MSISAKWTHLASEDRLRRSSQAVSVIDSDVYIFGGELAPREPVDNMTDILNVKTPDLRTVAATTLAPSPRVGSPSTRIGQNIYIFSGRGGLEMRPVEENGTLWSYCVKENTWQSLKPADPQAPVPAGLAPDTHTFAKSQNNEPVNISISIDISVSVSLSVSISIISSIHV